MVEVVLNYIDTNQFPLLLPLSFSFFKIVSKDRAFPNQRNLKQGQHEGHIYIHATSTIPNNRDPQKQALFSPLFLCSHLWPLPLTYYIQ